MWFVRCSVSASSCFTEFTDLASPPPLVLGTHGDGMWGEVGHAMCVLLLRGVVQGPIRGPEQPAPGRGKPAGRAKTGADLDDSGAPGWPKNQPFHCLAPPHGCICASSELGRHESPGCPAVEPIDPNAVCPGPEEASVVSVSWLHHTPTYCL